MSDDVIRRVDREPSNDFIIDSILNGTNKRQDDIRSLVDILNRIEGNYSIFIDGEWGIGKTIFVNQVSIALQSLNPSSCKDENLRSKLNEINSTLFSNAMEICCSGKTYYPIFLNAWKQDFYEDPLIIISSIIAENFKEHNDLANRGTSLLSAIAGLISSIKPSVTVMTPDATQQFSVSIDPEQAIRSFRKTDYLEHHKAMEKFKEDIGSALSDSAEGRADRFVLFVDELDRCRPEFAIRILETLRLFFDQDNLTIVFSANARALGESISSWYGGGFNGHRYLMRFYDMAKEITSYDIVSFLTLNGIEADRTDYIVKCISGHSLTMRDVNRCLHRLKTIYEIERSSSNQPIYLICSSFSYEIACLLGAKGQAARRDVLSGKGINLVQAWVKEFEGISEFIRMYIRAKNLTVTLPGTTRVQQDLISTDPSRIVEELYQIAFFDKADIDRFNSRFNNEASTIRYRVRMFFELQSN